MIGDVEMKEAQKNVQEYLAAIGRRGGLASRRELTRSHAKQMVAIREAKRAALKAGKSWPPRPQTAKTYMIELIYRKPLTIHGVPRSDVVAAVSAATPSMSAQSSTSRQRSSSCRLIDRICLPIRFHPRDPR
jgi:hypothetical protein